MAKAPKIISKYLKAQLDSFEKAATLISENNAEGLHGAHDACRRMHNVLRVASDAWKGKDFSTVQSAANVCALYAHQLFDARNTNILLSLVDTWAEEEEWDGRSVAGVRRTVASASAPAVTDDLAAAIAESAEKVNAELPDPDGESDADGIEPVSAKDVKKAMKAVLDLKMRSDAKKPVDDFLGDVIHGTAVNMLRDMLQTVPLIDPDAHVEALADIANTAMVFADLSDLVGCEVDDAPRLGSAAETVANIVSELENADELVARLETTKTKGAQLATEKAIIYAEVTLDDLADATQELSSALVDHLTRKSPA